jgi:hemerythrin-like domain-containing protein
MSATAALTDTRDMRWVHDAFRRALGDAPGQIASVEDGDAEKAQSLAGYLREVLWLLHAHHDGEDQLLYPLLAERDPGSRDLFARMGAQHTEVTLRIGAAERAAERFGETGSAEDGQAFAAACRSLLDAASGHLTEEEDEVVPIASRTVTPEEWGALPAHVFSHYSGPRPWLLLGIATEMFPDEVREQVFAHLPPPVSEMWFGFGSDAFSAEMATIRVSAPSDPGPEKRTAGG